MIHDIVIHDAMSDHSKQYHRKGHTRNNTICSFYLSDTQNIEYGEIVNFYVAEYPFCIINIFSVVNRYHL